MLFSIHRYRDEPRWVTAVHQEISVANHLQHCAAVLSFAWLGTPVSPLTDKEIEEVLNIQGRISFPKPTNPSKNLGEAQSIVVAKRLGAIFVTDDRDAFKVAENPQFLGVGKVKTACSLFYEALADGIITISQIKIDHSTLAAADRVMLCTKRGFSCG